VVSNVSVKRTIIGWANQVVKAAKSIFVFEKKKSRIGQLDLKVTML
jgi:hypothetical protein